MKRAEIRQLFEQAMGGFNAVYGTDFNTENTLLEFCTAKTAITVFEKFCGENFPHYLENNPYKEPDFFAHTEGMALIEGRKNGILMVTGNYVPRIEKKHRGNELFIILHELGHIFCIRSEQIPKGEPNPGMGDEFCGWLRPCGTVACGYRVWMELVADLVAYKVLASMTGTYRTIVDPDIILHFAPYTAKNNLNALTALAGMISEELSVESAVRGQTWEEVAVQAGFGLGGFRDKIYSATKMAYEHWLTEGIRIEEDFLEQFAKECMAFLHWKMADR